MLIRRLVPTIAAEALRLAPDESATVAADALSARARTRRLVVIIDDADLAHPSAIDTVRATLNHVVDVPHLVVVSVGTGARPDVIDPLRALLGDVVEQSLDHDPPTDERPSIPAEFCPTLRWAAVLGRRFRPGDLTKVVEEPDLAIAAIEAALEAGILREAKDSLAFVDAEAHACWSGQVTPALLPLRHRAALRKLDGAGHPALDLARHLLLARSALAPVDLALCMRISNAVRVCAPEMTADMLDVAAGLEPSPEDRRNLTLNRVDALFASGRVFDAEADAARNLVSAVDRDHWFALQERRIDALGYLGALVERRSLLNALGTTDLTEAERTSVDRATMETAYLQGDRSTALALTPGVLLRARASQNPVSLARSLGPASWVALAEGDVATAVQCAEEALALSRMRRERIERTHSYAGTVFDDADELDRAVEVYSEGLGIERSARIRSTAALHSWGLATALLGQGRLHDAQVVIDAAFRSIDDGSSAPVGLPVGIGCGALIAYHLGEEETVERLLALAPRGPVVPMGLVYQGMVRALVALDDDRPDEANDHMTEAWAACTGHGFQRRWRIALPLLARTAVAAGRADQLEQIAAQAQRGADAAPHVLSAVAAAARCRAWTEGDPDLATHAAHLLDACGRPLTAASAFEDAALIAAQRAEPTAEFAATALSRFGSLHAAADIDRVTRTFPYSDRRRVRRARATHGWASLTPAEIAVVGLVARGKSNPDVAADLQRSRHTIESHLKRIYSKMHLSSRGELTAAFLTDPDAPRST